MTLKPITCRYCGTALKFGKLLRRIYYSGLIVGILLGIAIVIDEDIFGVNISWYYFLLAIILLGTIGEIICWKYGELEEVE